MLRRAFLSAALLAASGSLALAQQRPNLLLVTVDTLRADRIGSYGYEAIETPVMDGLAARGVLLLDATVHAPQTRPSHASLLTGRLPTEHGIRDNFSPPLRADVPTLAERLKAAGYETAAFVGALPLTASSGLDRGFDLYDDPFGGPQRAGRRNESERRGETVVTSALGWLANRADRPFFAWVHLYDPHAPYEAPPPYSERYAASPYDGEVAYSDTQIGRLTGYLESRGWSDSTLVVVTSDHGEGLGEHGEDEHLLFVYDSTMRIPLIATLPGVLPAGARIGGQFRGVDLMPTLLELMGLEPGPSSGESRAQLLRDGAALPSNESYGESLYGNIHFGYAPLRSLRGRGFKYIDAPRPELYDIEKDPGETDNVIADHPRIAEGMKGVLDGYDSGDAPADAAAPADAGVMERMAALGYIGATGTRSGTPSGADPKDKVEEWQSYQRGSREAARLFEEERYDEALPLLQELSGGETVSFEVESLLGRTLIQTGRTADAIPHLEQALELLPDSASSYIELGRAYRETGQLSRADAIVDQGLARHAEHGALHRAKGLIAYQRGELPAARTSLERARDLVPENPQIRLMLSAVYRDQGDLQLAVAELRAAVEARPDFADGWNALGVLLGTSGDVAGATRALERGREAAPDDPDILFNLATAYLSAGRNAEALPLLESVSARAPRYPGLAQALAAAREAPRATAPAPRRSTAARGEAVRLRLIRVADRAAVDDVLARLSGGEDFSALASELSQDPSAARGGDLGDVAPGDLAGPLGDLARGLATGEVSAPLSTPAGYVLLYRER